MNHTVALEFLTHLYGSTEHGWLTVFTIDRTGGPSRTLWAPVDRPEQLLDQLDALAGPHCTWFGVATRQRRLTDGKRGGVDDCLQVPALWCDLDYAGPAHARTDLPADQAAAEAIIARFELAPTAVVHSGNGLQPWWLLDEPADIPDAVELLERWEVTWDRLAGGAHVDHVYDVPRIMRLPGTTNHKPENRQPLPVEIISADWTRRYGANDILELLDEVPQPERRPITLRAVPDGSERPGDRWAAATDWADLLEPLGWHHKYTDRHGERYWVRPGNDPRGHVGATTGNTANDRLKVFTSSAPPLVEGDTYSKFAFRALMEHGGDHAALAQQLVAEGWGSTQGPPPAVDPATGEVLEATWATPTLPAEPVPPPFPTASLPTWAQEHAVAAADQVQVPVDLTGMLIIGALSAACTGRATVRVSPNWAEPVNLYLVTAMRSGSGKSAAEKLCCGWLRTWQAERLAQVLDAYELARRVARVADKRAGEIEKSMITGNKTMDDLRHALEDAQTAHDAVPQLPRLLADDATPEAVANLLAAHGERLAIMSTEADLFDMVLKGKPGQRANLNVYLKAWSGDQMIRDRKGGTDTGPESTTLERPLMTIAVTVQPSVLRRLFADDEMVSRGFAARFMFALPPDLIGRRDQTRRFADAQLAGRDEFAATATALVNAWTSWKHPAPIHLEPAAAAALQAFLVEIEPRLAVGERYERLGEWVNKLHGSIARYAGLLHLAEHHSPSTPIDADTMARAIDLGRYWLDTAAIVMGHDQGVEEQALALLEFMTGDGRTEFTLPDLQKGVRRPGIGLDKAADYIPALEFLVEHRWLRELSTGWKVDVGKKGTPAARFALWPDAVGHPRSVVVSRVARIASMGERELSSPPPSAKGPPASPSMHAIRDARDTTESPPPVDNQPTTYLTPITHPDDPAVAF